jgi:long-subunit fatty acid transport protein
MKKITFLTFTALSIVVFSQNEEDALRYSQSYLSGSARNISMAGAMSSIGGDYSATSQNPAAMGRFNKNNFSFTPIIETNTTSSDFYGQQDIYRSTKVKVGNISYLKSYKLPEATSNGWTTLQLGIGYNRINSFENTKRYTGEADSSIIHNFINEANGTSPDYIFDTHPWGAALAYDVYAIDPAQDNWYTSELSSGNTIHERTIRSSGSLGELSFAMSGNYQNKFYLGGTANIVRAKYASSFSHKEEYTAKDSIWLNNTEYLGNLSTEGWGGNVKIGAIYLPTENLRLGLAIHSPTFFTMKDLWGNDMNSNTDDPDYPDKFIQDDYKPTGAYDYRVSTPFKANLSAAYTIKKKATVGAEIEYIDYSGSKLKAIRFSEAPYSFISENAQIKNIYRPRFNFKIGGEYRINPMLYLRGGYALYNSAFSKESGVNSSNTQFITGGLGINLGKYYFDLAVASKTQSYDYFAYNPLLNGSKATFNEQSINASITFGIRF